MKRVILYADDNPADRALFQSCLQEINSEFGLVMVEHGRDAIAYLRGDPPYEHEPKAAVVFLAMYMPFMGGKEVLMELRGRMGWSGSPPVVLSSGEAIEEQDARALYALGAAGVFRKACLEKSLRYWLDCVSL